MKHKQFPYDFMLEQSIMHGCQSAIKDLLFSKAKSVGQFIHDGSSNREFYIELREITKEDTITMPKDIYEN
jgi:hypothetical protein